MEVGREVRAGDVYRFSWHYDPKQTWDRMWCFDGQLVVRKTSDGSLLLVDTYFSFGERWYNSSRTFTLEEALKAGDIAYVCNLDEVEAAQPYEARLYDEADLFDLSYQHRCYPRLMKRKGAKKSKEAMFRALAQDRQEAEENLRSAVSKLEWIARTRQAVEDATDVEKLYP